MPLHVRYFEDKHGNLYNPPDESIRCPPHCIEKEANTIREVGHLAARMEQQARDLAERQGMAHEIAAEPVRKAIRDRIMTRMMSSSTSVHDREFLEHWLRLRDQKKREHYAELFEHRQIIVEALEYDRPRTPEEVLGESM